MEWKKHLKIASEIRASNTKLDMESMESFRNLLEDVKDSEHVVSLEFLKTFLRLRPENESAMDELKIKMTEIGDIDYFSLIDETDQNVYLGFLARKE